MLNGDGPITKARAPDSGPVLEQGRHSIFSDSKTFAPLTVGSWSSADVAMVADEGIDRLLSTSTLEEADGRLSSFQFLDGVVVASGILI